MAVTLDQILASTRLDLPQLGRRRSALEREAADRPAPPSLGRALRGERVARPGRSEATVAVGRDDQRRPGARRARGLVRASRARPPFRSSPTVLTSAARSPTSARRPRRSRFRCCARTSFSTSFRSWRRVRRAPRRCCSSFARSLPSGSGPCSLRLARWGSTHWWRCTRRPSCTGRSRRERTSWGSTAGTWTPSASTWCPPGSC